MTEREMTKEKDGIQFFPVETKIMTGMQMVQEIERFKNLGMKQDDLTKELMASANCDSKAEKTINVAVLKGRLFADIPDLKTDYIVAEAAKLGLTRPEPNLAYFLATCVSAAVMDSLGINFLVIMHEHIGGQPYLIAYRKDETPFMALLDGASRSWVKEDVGFVFVKSDSPAGGSDADH